MNFNYFWGLNNVVNVKQLTKASRNSAKSVSHKGITEVLQKAVPAKRQ